ncbi:SDR family NAD(P)-dependent oxidoreductase [Kitasatospora sp. NPDC057738]|uniref:SDR family NAD(P)-dependent oxidoreductase n=1 Tax=Kitasatospora sp. NPDC057738 TaxID=3346233 RepID=UPI003691FF54
MTNEFTDLPERDGVAIIGMAGRFPGAGDLTEFWSNLRDGVESIVALTDEELTAAGVPPEVFGRPHYVKAAPRFEGISLFDAEFFGYTAREAKIMDPQHRLFLETAWEALEHAGYDAARCEGRTGVFGGASTTAYLGNILGNLEQGEAIKGENVGLGFELAFLTSRVSYKLDLRGPSFPVQTACSSSLVALHAACQSLLNYECDMALSGAVSYKVQENTGYPYQEGAFLSPDGHIRPFDADARGTVFGNGVGVVALKRLEDALADGDTVHAVIKGSAINNDGGVKASFTAPTVGGQAEVITEALTVAEVDPEDIDYVEAHGSGTVIGDSIEVQALSRAFGDTGSWALGSVKGNIGHLDAAAGIAGLLKTTLALKHELLPASLNYTRGNPDIDFANSPFRVQAETGPWPRTDGRVRRAGISAFGFGGSNAHLILEEAPAVEASPAGTRPTETLILSARTPQALEEATDRLAAHLRREQPNLADAAHTLATGRRTFPHRRTVTGSSAEAVAAALEARDPANVVTGHVAGGATPLVFVFSGQGSQHSGMARDLYEQEAVFRACVDECAELLRPQLDQDIREVIFTEDSRLDRTQWAQPALFVVEYALTRLWQSWGITPTAMLGHSLGEWVAACVAGVFTLPDALHLVALRGRLMQAQAPGAMLNVMADRSTVEAALPHGLSLAAHNGPRDCVVSGPHDAIRAFTTLAEEHGWATQPVATSHAFHSHLMEPMVGEFVAAVAAVDRRAPQVPFVSNLTGTWITDGQAVDPGYWGNHVRACVEYSAGVRTATTEPHVTLLEVGPGQTFSSLARRILTSAGIEATALASLPHKRDRRTATEIIQRTLGSLWLTGARPSWAAYFAQQQRRRIPLPTYPFQRKRYWLEPRIPQAAVQRTPGPHPLLDQVLLRSTGQSVFLTEFSLELHWVLSEHKLLGEAIVPGTTYLEMARAAASLHFGRPVTELCDVTFLVPLLVQEGAPRTAHTTVREIDDLRAEFTVASHDPASDHWTVHVQGVVSVEPHTAPAPLQDPAALRELCSLESVDIARRQTEHKVMEFGDRWRSSLPTVHLGVRAALGVLDLPEQYRAECQDHLLHPTLLDQATGFSGFAVLETPADRRLALGDRDFFLPVGYDSLLLHGPLPARGLSFVQPHPGYANNAEFRKVDVVICDESGATAAEIRGFTVKRVADAKRTVAQLRPHTRHHTLRWVPAPAPEERRALPARVLVIGEQGGIGAELSAALRARGVGVAEAVLADRWQQTVPDRYEVPPTPEGFGRLLDALGAELPDEVVHVAAPADDGVQQDLSLLEARLGHGVHSLFHLARCLSERGVAPAGLSVVAPSVARVTGTEPATAPVHATLFGLAKVIGQEYRDTEVFCLDIAGDTGAEAVCAELLGARTPATVALRDGHRYVAELAPVHLREQPRSAPVRPDGVYLITGGLGGLGLAVARHLSRSGPGARLALVNRTELPPRERWDEVTDAKLRGQIEALRELERNGAEVRSYSGDVTDLAVMEGVVAKIRADLGAIGCVVHAAGVAGDGFLFRKDAETFRRTLNPKVLGATVLDLVTQDDPPDCMVNFGSTVAIFGAAGQGDYTAANSYLEQFAEQRSARGRWTVTVDWSDWLETGMAFDHGVQQDQGFFRSVSVEDGLSSFEEILASACTPVIVGEVNYRKLGGSGELAELLRRAPLVLAVPIRQAIAAARSSAGESAAPPDGTPSDGEPKLFGKESGEFSDTERALARIWARELDLTELNVRDTSFALGVDSLAALRIAQSIQKIMDIRVSMVDLFRYVTIADLADHLDTRDARA